MLWFAVMLSLATGDVCDAPRALPQTRISLDLKAANLHDVFRLFSQVANVNIVVPDEVQGTVTLALKDAPWGDAFCTVARAKKLTVTKVGDVFLVDGGLGR